MVGANANGEPNCVVLCPKCSVKSTLSQYWTRNGPAFRLFNFKRHVMAHANDKNSNVLLITEPTNLNQSNVNDENQLNVELALNDKLPLNTSDHEANVANRKKRYSQKHKVHSNSAQRSRIILSKTNVLRSKVALKRKPFSRLENISPQKMKIDDMVLNDENLQMQLNDAQTKLNHFESLENENKTLRSELNDARIELNRMNMERKFLLNANLELRGKIRVFCRLRPALENEEQMTKINFNVLPNQKLQICEF